MVAGFKSEPWPASNRYPRPACVGIRKRWILWAKVLQTTQKFISRSRCYQVCAQPIQLGYRGLPTTYQIIIAKQGSMSLFSNFNCDAYEPLTVRANANFSKGNMADGRRRLASFTSYFFHDFLLQAVTDEKLVVSNFMQEN
jgi:hypothetical protein